MIYILPIKPKNDRILCIDCLFKGDISLISFICINERIKQNLSNTENNKKKSRDRQ